MAAAMSKEKAAARHMFYILCLGHACCRFEMQERRHGCAALPHMCRSWMGPLMRTVCCPQPTLHCQARLMPRQVSGLTFMLRLRQPYNLLLACHCRA